VVTVCRKKITAALQSEQMRATTNRIKRAIQ